MVGTGRRSHLLLLRQVFAIFKSHTLPAKDGRTLFMPSRYLARQLPAMRRDRLAHRLPGNQGTQPRRIAPHYAMITDLDRSTGAEKQAKRLAAMPSSLRPLFARAYSNGCSPRAAIKAFCIECQGYERAAVTTCTAFACPLWRYRPFQKPARTT